MKNSILVITAIFLLSSCTKDNITLEEEPIDCEGQQIVFDDDLFENGSTDSYTIYEAKIVGDCLKIKYFAYSCTSIENWENTLVGKEDWNSEDIIYLRMYTYYGDSCDEVYANEAVIDLTPLKESNESGENQFIYLFGHANPIIYLNE